MKSTVRLHAANHSKAYVCFGGSEARQYEPFEPFVHSGLCESILYTKHLLVSGALGGGEGRSAIGALLKIVNASYGSGKASTAGEGKVERDESDGEEEGREEGGKTPLATQGRKKKGLKPLMRPIICICNDAFVPALRPLREVAKVIFIQKPQASRIGQRLRSVFLRFQPRTRKTEN